MKVNEYVKHPSTGDFIKTNLPTVILLTMWAFLVIPFLEFIEWLITRSDFFVLLSSWFEIVLYFFFVSFFLFWLFRFYWNLYHRMQKMPFLVLSKERICMDLTLLPHVGVKVRKGKIKTEWSAIQRIEVETNKFFVFFQENGKQKSEKVDLRWVEEKEDILLNLKSKCQKHKIGWIDDT